MEQFETAGIAVVAGRADPSEEVGVVAVLLEHVRAVADGAQQADDRMTEAAEAGEDDLGVVVLNIGPPVGFPAARGSDIGQDAALQQDQEQGGERHRESHRGDHQAG